jgi:Spy/CpxP family protein refolding chaperone
MFRAGLFALTAALAVLSSDLTGQDKKDDKKPAEPVGKVKGVLPPNWKKIGLTDTQVQDIYKVQNKYNDEIDKLEAKIRDLKTTRDKEMKAVLTAEQKKRLDDILTGKDK